MIYSPGTDIADDLPQPEAETPATTTDSANPGSTETKQLPASVDAKAILDAINADREARENKSRTDLESATYKKRFEEAEAKLNDIEKAKKNRMLDPAGYLRKLGYSDRELALTSEGIMFSLMPDKAPPAHIANLVKAQREQDLADQEAREKARDAETQKRETDAHSAQEKAIEARYQGSLKNEVASMKPGTFPATQAWYAEDHDGYAQELFETARTLAEQAVKAGKSLDVSAAAIGQHVEKKYAERAKRLAAVFSQSQTTTQPQKQAPKEQPSVQEETKSVVGKKLTDKELISRATQAAFRA